MTDDTLTPAEQAYFDSRGEAELPAEPAVEAPAEAPKETTDAEAPKEAATEAAPSDKEPEVQKLVPHGAFEEERQRRKESQKEAAQLRERLAFLEGQQAALGRSKSAEAGRELDGQLSDQLAEWEKDPEGKPIEALKGLIADRRAREEAAERQTKLQAEVQQIVSIGQADCAEFAKTQPLFFGNAEQPGAYEFLRNATAEKLRAQGCPPHELRQAVDMAEIQLINEARQKGLSPARAIWHWAHVAGFEPKAAAPAAKPGPTEAEKIAALEKAQGASKSLGSVPGGGGDIELTLEMLGKMSDEEFAKVPESKRRAAMGG